MVKFMAIRIVRQSVELLFKLFERQRASFFSIFLSLYTFFLRSYLGQGCYRPCVKCL